MFHWNSVFQFQFDYESNQNSGIHIRNEVLENQKIKFIPRMEKLDFFFNNLQELDKLELKSTSSMNQSVLSINP